MKITPYAVALYNIFNFNLVLNYSSIINLRRYSFSSLNLNVVPDYSDPHTKIVFNDLRGFGEAC